MIIIVGASVIATIIIIHMSRISYRPAPSWVRWLILNKLPRFVCIDDVRTSHRHMTTSLVKSSDKYILQAVANIGKPAFSSSESVSNNGNASSRSSNFEELMQEEQQNQHEWKLVSLVVDRYLMVIFSTATIVITVSLLAVIILGSRAEFDKEIEILNNSWKMAKRRSLWNTCNCDHGNFVQWHWQIWIGTTSRPEEKKRKRKKSDRLC